MPVFIAGECLPSALDQLGYRALADLSRTGAQRTALRRAEILNERMAFIYPLTVGSEKYISLFV